MTTALHPPDDLAAPAGHDRRWLALGVVCLGLYVVLLDTTIVNVALPTLVGDLQASTSELQWVVDAYNLVFAALLLAAGGLGDRFGRAKALWVGLIIFAATSALAATSDDVGELITARALMGVGAALVFPATLALIASLFPDAAERTKAIGIWTAITGVGVATGPIIGGWLLEHYWWGSIFLVNLPVVVVALALGLRLVPDSRDREARRLDLPGLGLSIAAMTLLVFTIIEAPEAGWTSVRTLSGFAAAAALVAVFVAVERRSEDPLLPVGVFGDARFSAASAAITIAFFSLFGFIFLVTQYFQFVRGYTPLQAGVRTIPVAVSIGVAANVGAVVARRIGPKRVVAGGLACMALSFLWISLLTRSTSYLQIAGQMVLLGVGLGGINAPATDSLMGSLPVDQAGVGSAVNDTTRELGGTLGVAVVGSVFNSVYASRLGAAAIAAVLPVATLDAAEDSLGAALGVAGQVGGASGSALAAGATAAFLDGLGVACLLVAAVTAVGAVLTLRFLPGTTRQPA